MEPREEIDSLRKVIKEESTIIQQARRYIRIAQRKMEQYMQDEYIPINKLNRDK